MSPFSSSRSRQFSEELMTLATTQAISPSSTLFIPPDSASAALIAAPAARRNRLSVTIDTIFRGARNRPDKCRLQKGGVAAFDAAPIQETVK
jgi:hypothetical protein